MTVSSESEVVKNIHSTQQGHTSLEVLKIGHTEDEEDSVFSRFYALSEHDGPKNLGDFNPKSKNHSTEMEKAQQKGCCSCFKELFFCCWKKEKREITDYYSQF